MHEGPIGIGGGTVTGDVIRKNPRMLAYYLEPIEEGGHVAVCLLIVPTSK